MGPSYWSPENITCTVTPNSSEEEGHHMKSDSHVPMLELGE